MNYVGESVCSTLAPKLLGTYELELTEWIERLINHRYDKVINIGSAEGYYAVGFALRCTGTRVVAFEADSTGRSLIAELAQRNSVANRVTIAGLCSAVTLRPHLDSASTALLIVDIEGGELALLDATVVPELNRCQMLIELHEDAAPAADILRGRFSATHQIEEIWSRTRTARDLPAPFRWFAPITPTRRLVQALSEQRPGPMRWFLCTPSA
jgi:hypothetical protein